MQRDSRRHPQLYRAMWVMLGLMTIAAAIAMVSIDGPPAPIDPDAPAIWATR